MEIQSAELDAAAPHAPPKPRVGPFWYLGRVGLGLVLVFSLIILVNRVFEDSRGLTDYCQDYQAAQRLTSGARIYAPLRCFAGTHIYVPTPQEFDTHPPPAVFPVWPLGFLPFLAAATVWGLLSLAAYLISGLLLLREVGWRSLGSFTLFVVGSLFWWPFTNAQEEQNWAQVTLLLLVVAWVLERRGHARWAGVLLGLAGLFKIWPAVFLALAVFQRRWQTLWGGIITLAAGTTLSALVLGIDAYVAYFGPVQANVVYWLPSEGNMALAGVITRLLAGYRDNTVVLVPLAQGVGLRQAALAGEIVGALALVAVLVFLWRCHRRAQGEITAALSLGILVTVALLAFPLTWPWGLITLLLPVATTLLALRQLPRPPFWWFALVLLGLLPAAAPQFILFNTSWTWGAAGAILFGLITYGLVGFTVAQAILLYRVANLPPGGCTLSRARAPADRLERR